MSKGKRNQKAQKPHENKYRAKIGQRKSPGPNADMWATPTPAPKATIRPVAPVRQTPPPRVGAWTGSSNYWYCHCSSNNLHSRITSHCTSCNTNCPTAPAATAGTYTGHGKWVEGSRRTRWTCNCISHGGHDMLEEKCYGCWLKRPPRTTGNEGGFY